jgi:hypothetical protein
MSKDSLWEDECKVDDDDDSVNSLASLTPDVMKELFINGGIGVKGAREQLLNRFNHYTPHDGTASSCNIISIKSLGLKKKQMKCQICDYEERGNQRYKDCLVCKTHNVRACGFVRKKREQDDAYSLIKVPSNEPVTDFSWILGDNGTETCMEKFHKHYLPEKLFTDKPPPVTDNKANFVCIRTSSALYKKKKEAFGIEQKENRGRKRKQDNPAKSTEK